MATFSTNQARQIYVAKKVNETIYDAQGVLKGAAGDIKCVAKPDYIYFEYVGPETPLRSDLIKKDLIMSATLTHGNNIQKFLNEYEVTITNDPIAGQEYILRIDMLGYASLGIENTYQKYGFVKATKNMTKAQFYAKLAKSLAGNFAREPYPVYEFIVTDGTTSVTVTANTDFDTLTVNYTKLIIREVSGYWHVGTDEDMPQLANIFTDRILNEGVEELWGEVKTITNTVDEKGNPVINLKPRKDTVYRQLADLEYFLMGERADKYRLVGWPKVIYTDYMIDKIGLTPEQFLGTKDENGVSIIDIHYSYVGSNESVQKSEKDICIILPNTTSNGALVLAQAIADAGVTVVHKNYKGVVSTL
jgi:hypothetical protein